MANEAEDKYHGVPPGDKKVPDESPVPAKGKRASFDSIRRQLTDDELKTPAVQKLLLDMLEEAETARDEYKCYVNSYHDADKRASVLSVQLQSDRAIEVFFGGGLALGGIICGLAPYFYELKGMYGNLCLFVGILLIVVACVGRVIKK